MNDMKSIRFPPPVADEMIRAILDNRKTVTRRVVKPQPLSKIAYVCMGYKHGTCGYPGKDAWKYWDDESFRLPDNLPDGEKDKRWTPPCHTGDILYVRETWQRNPYGIGWPYFYKASPEQFDHAPDKWRSSTSMPREAARLFLRVTDVRVERLQDITKEQALSEGVPDDSDYPLDNPVYCPKCKGEGIIGAIHPESLGYMEADCPYCDTPQKRFSHLWDSTIKKPADRALYGWAANPWVWVIEFERCEKAKEK